MVKKTERATDKDGDAVMRACPLLYLRAGSAAGQRTVENRARSKETATFKESGRERNEAQQGGED